MTAFNPQEITVEGKSQNGMKFSLLNENDETTSGNINGHIIMGSPVVEEGQLYNETGFDLSINLVNNEQQTVSDSLLFYDIFF